MIALGLDLLFLIPDETGGRETYTRELMSAVMRRAPDLALTAFVNRETPASWVRALGGRPRVIRLPVSARRPDSWALGEAVLLPAAGRRAGIALLHSPANFAPVRAPFRRVMSLHDLQYRAVPELLTRARRIGTAVLLEAAARRADRLITGSHASRLEIEEALGIPGERIDVIHHGLGLPVPDSVTAEDELRSRYRLRSRPVVLSVSTDLPHKNLDVMIEALSRMEPAARPVAVIAGPRTDSGRLAQHARAAGVVDDVRLLGFQSAPDLEGLYRLATCAVFPTLYEGFGLPVVEAMTRGVPVICSDIPPVQEVAGNAALSFRPDSAEELAAAVARLLADRALRDDLILRGRRRAADFSWDAAAQATLSSYERAMGGR